MFTGIIQNQGRVSARTKGRGGQIRFIFQLKKKEKSWVVGESIAVNGVCLTAAEIFSKGFAADVIPETLQATTLNNLQVGHNVNLERSLKYGDRLGGHFVTGHVDGCGPIRKIEKRGKNWLMVIEPPEKIYSLLAPKGSIAVDGISLTIQSLTQKEFAVALIPHTLEETVLKQKSAGDRVNLEVDVVTRYITAILNKHHRPSKKSTPRKLSLAELKKQGF
ncbi:MAG TPA: riboflavin synthase [bacterium]|nr:riboflavin synthase [bacterium]